MIKFNTRTLTDIIFSLNRMNQYTPKEMGVYKTTLELILDLEDLYSTDPIKDSLIDSLIKELEELTPLPKNFRCDMDTLKGSLVDLDLLKESIEDLIS